MIRYSWFDHDPVDPEITEYDIGEMKNFDVDKLSYWIQKEFEVGGKPVSSEYKKDSTIILEYVHPGTRYVATIQKVSGSMKIETYRQNPYQIVSVFHRLHKYGGGVIYNIYVFMMDISSLSLIVFVISGIILWLKVIKNRWLGIVFLLTGVVYTLWVFLTFWYG